MAYRQTNLKKNNQDNNAYTGIKKLQGSIVELLSPYGEFRDKNPFYLENDFSGDFDTQEYQSFLSFLNDSLKRFKTTPQINGIVTIEYQPSKLTSEDKKELLKKKYEEFVDKDYYLESKTRSAKIKTELMENTFFEKKSDQEIIDMIKDIRLPNLEICSKNPNKSAIDKLYYSTEKKRMDEIFSKKPDISLGELADKIIWSAVSMFKPNSDTSQNQDNIIKVFKDHSQNPDNIIELFNHPDNEKYVLQLMTYIPFDFFEKDDNGKWKIKHQEMKEFLIASNMEDNIQQIVLGFTRDLGQDWFKQFRQLAHCYSFQFDSVNNCGELVDWSMKLNFLMIYLFSRSLKKVFPIRFKMPSNNSGYNESNNTYSFKKTYTLKPSVIFNKSECEEQKGKCVNIIGITLFNTKYKYKHTKMSMTNYNRQPATDRIFIILHCKILDKGSMRLKLSALDRQTGKNTKYVDYNIFLGIVSNGLFETQGVSYQELVSVNNYFKLTPYIIGNDKENIFFTARNKSDSELARLIKELNLQKVKIDTRFKNNLGFERTKITLNTSGGGEKKYTRKKNILGKKYTRKNK